LEDHDFLLEIDVDFINDKMNLLKLREEYQSTQLQQKNMEEDRYRECLRLIKSSKVPNEEDLQSQKFLELN
jgi:Casein kinase II regulatory subunit